MKAMLVVDGIKNDSYNDFKVRTISKCAELATESSIEKLKVVLTDHKPPNLSIIPFSKRKVAVISLYYTTDQLPSAVLAIENLRSAHSVTEALPVAYKKDWADGLVTPGINLLTLFRKKPNLDHRLFLDLWHNGHTPLSLKIHPLWNYNRNVVEEDLIAGQSTYDGIVEEQVNKESQLLNPFNFFGNPLKILPNMIKVYMDVKKFIYYPSIETYLANEYWIKS